VAEDLYKQALALDPNNPDVLHFYREVLVQVGRLKEALAMSHRLQALEPYVGIFNGVTAGVLWLNGQNDAAISILKELRPGPPLAGVYASMGRYREAADVLMSMPAGDYPPEAAEEAARIIRTAPARIPSAETLPRLGLLGFVYLYVGAPERALEYYEGTADAGYVGGITNAVLWGPDYAPVRKTERFKAILRKIGTVEYWRARGWPPFCHPTTGDDFICN
jgi:tetratricopeptide (TPR) repeat protein